MKKNIHRYSLFFSVTTIHFKKYFANPYTCVKIINKIYTLIVNGEQSIRSYPNTIRGCDVDGT